MGESRFLGRALGARRAFVMTAATFVLAAIAIVTAWSVHVASRADASLVTRGDGVPASIAAPTAPSIDGPVAPEGAVVAPGRVPLVTITAKTQWGATLSWGTPTDGGGVIDAYMIGWSPDGSSWRIVSIVDGSTHSGDVALDSPDVRGVYGVVARNGVGTGPWGVIGDAISVGVGFQHACSLGVDHLVRCWGENGDGQLGSGYFIDSAEPKVVEGLFGVQQLSVGAFSNCAVMTNHNVRCWGDNGFGQVGDGTSRDRPLAVRVAGVTTAVQVAVSSDHGCALLQDSTVTCWGMNFDGQLGSGSTSPSIRRPALVPGITTATQIAVAMGYSCALLADSSVKCWGSNSFGQLGTDDTSVLSSITPVVVKRGSTQLSATKVVLENAHGCAISTDAHMKCWGGNMDGVVDPTKDWGNIGYPVDVAGFTGVADIGLGPSVSCATFTDTTTKCFGSNRNGQFGTGTTSIMPTAPTTVAALTGFTSLDGGTFSACAVLADGSVRCSGYDDHGQLGDASTTNRFTYDRLMVDRGYLPTAPRSLSATRLSSSSMRVEWMAPASDGGKPIGDHLIQYSKDGTNWTTLAHDALTATSIDIPILLPDTNYSFRISAVNSVGVGASATTTGSTAQGPGMPTGLHVVDRSSTSISLSWTAPTDVGSSAISDYSVEYSDDDGVTWSTFDHIASTSAEAVITGLTPGSTYLVRVAAVNSAGRGSWASMGGASQVSAGGDTTCVLYVNGSVACAGRNDHGQLGDGTTTDHSSLTPVVLDGAASQIAVGPNHTCAIVRDGVVECWGRNADGQLGVAGGDSSSPVVVPGVTRARVIAAGGGHTCVVTVEGQAVCWGANGSGQIGNGDMTASAPPTVVANLPSATDIALGANHSCALLADQTVRCWGMGLSGQLGNNSSGWATSPVAVSNLTNVLEITAAGSNSCAISATGVGHCWGSMVNGMLGDGDMARVSNAKVPVPVAYVPGGATNVVPTIALGSTHACAVTIDGVTRCWGSDDHGDMGFQLISSPSTNTPQASSTFGGSVVELALGTSHTCARHADGTVSCVGANASGQLADGTATDRVMATTTVAPSMAVVTGGVPGEPTGVSASQKTSTSMRLTWIEPTDGGRAITDHVISVSTNGIDWSTFVHDPSAGDSIVVDGLTPGTTYRFRIAATNAFGTGTAVDFDALLASPPGHPEDPTVTGHTANSVSLSWGAPLSNGGSAVTNYRVEWTVDGESWMTYATDDANTRSATITGLTATTRYFFRLRAQNGEGIGISTYSVEQSTSQVATAPTAPLYVRFDGTTRESVSLRWSEPFDSGGLPITGYLVQFRTGGGAWTDVAMGSSTLTFVQIWGLQPATAYEFHVAAVTDFGPSAWSTPASVTTVVVPDAPTGLTVTARTVNSVSLRWTAPSGTGGAPITDYLIERSTAGGPWVAFTHTPSTATEVTVTGLPLTSALRFRVSAMNSVGTGAATSELATRTGSAPGKATGLTVTASNESSATVQWTQPVDTGGIPITDYEVQKLAPGGSWTTVSSGTSTSTSFNFTGLTARTNYQFRVQVVTAFGAGAWSDPVSATTIVRASAPSGLTSTAKTATSVSLRWVAPTYTGGRTISDYVIEYKTAAASSWTPFSHTASTAVTATVTGLTRGGNYSFRVAAKTSDGAGLTSAEVAVVPAVKAAAPTALTVTAATTSSVGLRWTAPTDNGGRTITDYKVEYKKSSVSTWSPFAHDASMATTINVTGLTRATGYDFRVSTVTAEGTSVATSTVSSTTISVPWEPFTLAVSGKDATSVSLVWSPPWDDGGRAVTDYKVEYQRAGGLWTVFAHPASTAQSIRVTGLTKGMSYSFRVSAVNSVGTGPTRAPVTAIPAVKAAAPTGLALVSKTATSVSLRWVAPTDNGGRPITDYKVEYSTNGTQWSTFAHTVGTSASINVTGLSRGTAYRFRVSAVTAEGVGAACTQITATPSSSTVSSSPSVVVRTMPDLLRRVH